MAAWSTGSRRRSPRLAGALEASTRELPGGDVTAVHATVVEFGSEPTFDNDPECRRSWGGRRVFLAR